MRRHSRPAHDRRPDDDRLLTYILGLESDPELAAAADDEAATPAASTALRVELAHVARRVKLAVPLPEPDYTDLATARWDLLSEAIATDARSTATPKPRPLPRQAVVASRQRSLWSRRWFRCLDPGGRGTHRARRRRERAAEPADPESLAERSGHQSHVDSRNRPWLRGRGERHTAGHHRGLDGAARHRARRAAALAHNGRNVSTSCVCCKAKRPRHCAWLSRHEAGRRRPAARPLHSCFGRNRDASRRSGELAAEAQTAPLTIAADPARRYCGEAPRRGCER